jgi:hypothetical protein
MCFVLGFSNFKKIAGAELHNSKYCWFFPCFYLQSSLNRTVIRFMSMRALGRMYRIYETYAYRLFVFLTLGLIHPRSAHSAAVCQSTRVQPAAGNRIQEHVFSSYQIEHVLKTRTEMYQVPLMTSRYCDIIFTFWIPTQNEKIIMSDYTCEQSTCVAMQWCATENGECHSITWNNLMSKWLS